MSEISDTEFLDRIVENEDFDLTADELDRLIALARRGADDRLALRNEVETLKKDLNDLGAEFSLKHELMMKYFEEAKALKEALKHQRPTD